MRLPVPFSHLTHVLAYYECFGYVIHITLATILRSLQHRNLYNRICLGAWNPDWHNRNLSVLQISQWLNSEPWYWRQSISESVVYFNHKIWLSARKCFTEWHEL